MDWIDEQIAAEQPELGVVESCQYVVANADDVRIDDAALLRLVVQWADEAAVAGDAAALPTPEWDADLHFFDPADPEKSAFYILLLDTLNFSFWPDDPNNQRWQVPYKGEMVDGYYALAASLTKAFRGETQVGILNRSYDRSYQFLSSRAPESLEKVFTTDGHGPIPLLFERAKAADELGEGTLRRTSVNYHYTGTIFTWLEEAKNSAVRLALMLARDLSSFNDVAPYKGREIHFFKRAQIAANDLYGAFGGQGVGAFHDIDKLTIFADYKLPQVLRHYGALVYSPALAQIVDRYTLILPGDPREVEIRAATIIACERLRNLLAERGIVARATQIDWKLWYMGQAAKKEGMLPYHRTRTIYY